jgi:hypothetical protein
MQVLNENVLYVADNSDCAIADVVFVIQNSIAISSTSKEIVQSFVQRIDLSKDQYQVGVVTFGDTAHLAIPLQSNASTFLAKVDQLSFVVGRPANLRSGLFVARTQALAYSSGARPAAYQVVVLIWDGQPPGSQYGTVYDEAPRLTQSGADVFLVTTAAVVDSQLAALIASNITYQFVVGQSLNASDISASIASNVNQDCQRLNTSGKTQATTTLSSLAAGDSTLLPAGFSTPGVAASSNGVLGSASSTGSTPGASTLLSTSTQGAASTLLGSGASLASTSLGSTLLGSGASLASATTQPPVGTG